MNRLLNMGAVPPQKWSGKSVEEEATNGSRQYYGDGRITDFETDKPVGPAGAEVEIWSSGKDWRSLVEVALNVADSSVSQQMDNAAVRIYARTGPTIALLKQGRASRSIPSQQTVVRASGHPCDEYVVKVIPVTDYVAGGAIPKFSFAMHGFETHAVPDIKRTLNFGPVALNVNVSPIPAFFYGCYATLDPTAAATQYLWICDLATTISGGYTVSIVPPIPIQPGSVGSLQLSDELAVYCFSGLSWGWSTTFATFTAAAVGGSVNLEYT